MGKLKQISTNIVYMFSTMWNFSKTLFCGKFLIAVLNGVIAPLNAYIVKILIEYITQNNWNASLITIGVIAGVNLLNGCLLAFVTKKLGVISDLFRNYLMFEFNSKIANMDYEILYAPVMIQKKDMALKAIQEGRAINYLDITFSCVSSLISLISILYLLSSFSWWVFVIIFILCTIRIVTVIIDKKRTFNTSLELAPLNTEITYYMNMLTDEIYVNDIRMLSISQWVIHKYKKCVEKSHAMLRKLLNQVYKSSLIRTLLSALETAFLYFFSALQMIFYGMSFANFTLVTSTLRTFSDCITNITQSLINMGENTAYVQIYIQFMNIANVIAVPGKGKPAGALAPSDAVFVLRGVCFKYPGADSMALENINLEIDRGNFYVVVGKNGAGKTTLIKLLCRLYDVTSGLLLYRNTDVKDIEYQSYRDNIGIVFQDYKYYCLSIAENVAMNEYDDSMDTHNRILDALNKAGLGEKIAALPKGIHTQLGKIFDEEGIILSGGELQKLALARVLFKNPPIVILDEPSSALDAFAENELIKTFNSVLKGKTVIYISHRLSVAKYADKVIYVANKSIEGFDTHENLLKTSASYKDMYNAQAMHYQ